jgi:uncharacterized membrane protein
MSKDRVETFSDGVFAIVLTLLVLGIQVPNITNHSTFSQYAAAMAPVIPKFVTFVLSFATISVHWVSHHYFFSRLKKTPLGLVWLNNLFLLWICLMPFPTVLLGSHPTDQFPIIIYGINQLLCALTFFAFRIYATRNNLFIDKESAKAMGPMHSLPAITCFTLSILFAFINVYLSLLSFSVVPLLYFVPNLLDSKSLLRN